MPLEVIGILMASPYLTVNMVERLKTVIEAIEKVKLEDVQDRTMLELQSIIDSLEKSKNDIAIVQDVIYDYMAQLDPDQETYYIYDEVAAFHFEDERAARAKEGARAALKEAACVAHAEKEAAHAAEEAARAAGVRGKKVRKKGRLNWRIEKEIVRQIQVRHEQLYPEDPEEDPEKK